MADPNILTYKLVDDEGRYRSVQYFVDNAATLAEMQAFATEHLNLLEAVVGGVVSKITVQFALNIVSPNNTVPEVDHPVDNGALAAFSATGTQYRHGMYLPTFRKTLITAGAIPNTGATLAWDANLLAPSATVTLTDKAGRALASFLSAERTNRK